MFEFLLLLALGGIFLFIGWSVWKKEQITLIHDYHYSKVSESDIKPYTEQMGKACFIIGVGMLLTGLIDFITQTSFGWIFFIVFFFIGLFMMIRAQLKYNGGIF